MYIPKLKFLEITKHFQNQILSDKKEIKNEKSAVNRRLNIIRRQKQDDPKRRIEVSHDERELKKDLSRLKKNYKEINQLNSKIEPLIKIIEYHVRST